MIRLMINIILFPIGLTLYPFAWILGYWRGRRTPIKEYNPLLDSYDIESEPLSYMCAQGQNLIGK